MTFPASSIRRIYVVQFSNGRSMTVAGSLTTANFSSGFDYNRNYSCRVYAFSSSGSWSSASNTVSATLPNDTAPAATPVVSSTDIGPTHVDLAWSYADNDPSPRFDIYVNGQLSYGQVAGTSKRISLLTPSTLYIFRVRARDSAGNWSDLSDPFMATTSAPPPSTFGTTSIGMASSKGSTIDPYAHQFTIYLTLGIANTINVYAVDEAGNRSTPASVTFDLRTP